jgi:hypothetical protein
MLTLESLQGPQSVGNPAQKSLGNGHVQQRIAVLGSVVKQGFTCGQRLGKFLLSKQRTNPGYSGSDR